MNHADIAILALSVLLTGVGVMIVLCLKHSSKKRGDE